MSLHQVVSVLLLGGIASSCQVPDRDSTGVSTNDPANVLYTEEEFFGNVYQNGVRTLSNAYRAVLVAADPVTSSRLIPPHSDNVWADPNPLGSWMYGWFDPKGGGLCGDLANYQAGNLSARGDEIHRPNPGVPPTGKETHCIRPGSYQFTLQGSGKSFLIDYLQSAAHPSGSTRLIDNSTAGVAEAVEPTTYADINNFSDYIVHVDVTPGGHSDQPVLDVDNALADPYKTTFANSASPSGNENDHFRFSTARSTSSWNLTGPRGRALTRLYWDFGTILNPSTGYYDAHSDLSKIRWHRFADHVATSRNAQVGIELMRPDEQPDDVNGLVFRTVNITRLTPFACDTLQAVTVWRTTDQYLSAGCSTLGANIRYRWRFSSGGVWTAYSADTLHDFSGHTATGSQPIWLEVKNLTTGLATEHARSLNVQSGQVSLTGPTFIEDKGTKIYNSNILAQWFERYNPALVPWFPATAYPEMSMSRIWPAGDYSVELRQQDSTASLLRRGRLHITVCHDDPECGPLVRTDETVSGTGSNDLFGIGPWLSWSSAAGPQAVRFYDLLGMHDHPSRFTDRSWVSDSNGVTASAQPFEVTTTRSPSTTTDRATAYGFSIQANDDAPYVFGIALDPDLGQNPTDDESGFDATRGMVYVLDAERALGFLIRSQSGNALASAQQVGVGRWAPTSAGQAWQLQRQTGTRLLAGRRDVQFVLSTPATRGSLSVTLLVVRGRTLGDLQSAADLALGTPPAPR